MKSRLLTLLLLIAVPLAALGLWQFLRDDGGRGVTNAAAEKSAPRLALGDEQAADSLLGELLDGESMLSREVGLPDPSRRVEQESVDAEQQASTIDSASMNVRGFIYDPLGKPVSGAEVSGAVDSRRSWTGSYDGDLGRPVFSAPDGSFTLTEKQAGPFRLRVSAAGFAPFERRAISLPRSAEFAVADVLLDWGANLQGVVLDPGRGPVAGAEVYSRIPSAQPFGRPELRPVATTDESGAFMIDRLGVGAWTLVVETEDFPDAVLEGQSQRAQELQSGIEIVLGQAADIRGVVLGIPSGNAEKLCVTARLADAKTPWSKPQRQALVAADGSFQLTGLGAGESYALAVYPDAKRGASFFSTPLSKPLTLEAGLDNVELNFILGGSLILRVVDEETQLPITGLVVKAGFGWTAPLRDENQKIIKDFPEGKVRFVGLRPNMGNLKCQLQISSVGYRDFKKNDIQLDVGEELDLGQIELSAIPVVRVLVVDSRDGLPIESARVLMRRESSAGGDSHELDHMGDGFVERRHAGDQVEGLSNADGLSVLSSFEDQVVSIRVNAEGFAPLVLRNLHLPLRRDLEQTIALGQGGQVRVTVLDSAGAPVGGVSVSQRRLGDDEQDLPWKSVPERSLVTDAEGHASFLRLQQGTQRFRLKSGARTQSSFLPVISEATGEGIAKVVVTTGGEHQVLLQSPALCALEGRLTEAGKPLSAASVELIAPSADEDPDQRIFSMNRELNRSDSNGSYRIEALKAGEYKLIIKHPGRSMAASYPVRIVEGENRADIDLSVSIVEGRVVSQEGQPIAGVRVTAQLASGGDGSKSESVIVFSGGGGVISMNGHQKKTTVSAADGSYRLRGVADGVELVLTAEGSMVQDLRSETFVLDRDELRLSDDLVLELAGSIKLELLVDGKPAPIAQVTAILGAGGLGEQEEARTSQLIQDGKGVLGGLRPGIWSLAASTLSFGQNGGQSSAEIEVEVRAGEEIFQTLHLDIKD